MQPQNYHQFSFANGEITKKRNVNDTETNTSSFAKKLKHSYPPSTLANSNNTKPKQQQPLTKRKTNDSNPSAQPLPKMNDLTHQQQILKSLPSNFRNTYQTILFGPNANNTSKNSNTSFNNMNMILDSDLPKKHANTTQQIATNNNNRLKSRPKSPNPNFTFDVTGNSFFWLKEKQTELHLLSRTNDNRNPFDIEPDKKPANYLYPTSNRFTFKNWLENNLKLTQHTFGTPLKIQPSKTPLVKEQNTFQFLPIEKSNYLSDDQEEPILNVVHVPQLSSMVDVSIDTSANNKSNVETSSNGTLSNDTSPISSQIPTMPAVPEPKNLIDPSCSGLMSLEMTTTVPNIDASQVVFELQDPIDANPVSIPVENVQQANVEVSVEVIDSKLAPNGFEPQLLTCFFHIALFLQDSEEPYEISRNLLAFGKTTRSIYALLQRQIKFLKAEIPEPFLLTINRNYEANIPVAYRQSWVQWFVIHFNPKFESLDPFVCIFPPAKTIQRSKYKSNTFEKSFQSIVVDRMLDLKWMKPVYKGHSCLIFAFIEFNYESVYGTQIEQSISQQIQKCLNNNVCNGKNLRRKFFAFILALTTTTLFLKQKTDYQQIPQDFVNFINEFLALRVSFFSKKLWNTIYQLFMQEHKITTESPFYNYLLPFSCQPQ